MNLASIVFESAQKYPNQNALRPDTTYLDLKNAVTQQAHQLVQLGMKEGDKVALMCENKPEFTVAYFAILAVGAVVVPVNILHTAREVVFAIDHAGVSVFAFSSTVANVVEKSIALSAQKPLAVCIDNNHKNKARSTDQAFLPTETAPNQTAVILYTSGTTSQPKGAELTHNNLLRNAKWVSEKSLSAGGGTVPEVWGTNHCTLAVLSLSHSFGQTCMQNAPLLHGGAICYLNKFNPEDVLVQLQRHRVSIFAGVPRMLKALNDTSFSASQPLEAFKYCLVGGAPIDQEVAEQFEMQFGVEVLEGYGLSETSPVIAFRTPEIPRKKGSVGRVIAGAQIKAVDEGGVDCHGQDVGEIVVKGHPVMKGYLHNAALTAKTIREGWLYTGDVGYVDSDGDVFLLDRKDDVIIRNGYNVYPTEVEEVLCAFPGVLDAAVVGLDDLDCGQEIVAFIVGKVNADDLMAFSKTALAAYKYPRVIHLVGELPKGSKGQVLRRLLRDG